MERKKCEDIMITELFTAKAGNDWTRYFHGTIKREKDENGNECLVRGKINIKTKDHNGYILATAKDQWELGKKLDELILLILDNGLHESNETSSRIGESIVYFN